MYCTFIAYMKVLVFGLYAIHCVYFVLNAIGLAYFIGSRCIVLRVHLVPFVG